ncbi:glycosyltransferase [Arcticibacter sp.]|jgi:glycosyltransferase involved in cell wall biosynthesis|uniref:glycosyltransferase n=1 Tax=Arcticibacter sp. TaxID=1872630 RepID=UPI003890A192
MKTIFFIVSSLQAGGSERVYWLLSQYLDKSKYKVTLIVLDSRNPFFSPEIEGVRVIRLNSIRVSLSFSRILNLVRSENPHAVFTTGSHITALLSIVSIFCRIPTLVARESNVLEIILPYSGFKSRIIDLFVPTIYRRIKFGICQSEEVKSSLIRNYHIPDDKLVVIPNPVLSTPIIKCSTNRPGKHLIVVARLAKEKGLFRLLDIFSALPFEYTLTIVGDGPVKAELQEKIHSLGVANRVKLAGVVQHITKVISEYDLMVLTSFTEGFPNVVIESLSVGVPVVSFNVSGIPLIIRPGFNGYIIDQGDLQSFKEHTVKACNASWNSKAIKEDIIDRFGINKIAASYENLLS